MKLFYSNETRCFVRHDQICVTYVLGLYSKLYETLGYRHVFRKAKVESKDVLSTYT
jgi:hypothetical protein